MPSLPVAVDGALELSVPVVGAGLAFAAAVLLAEAVVCAAVSEAGGVCGAGACGAGGCDETLLCGWFTVGVVVSAALVVASSSAANGEPSKSCAGGVGNCRWEEAMVKVALTSDAELGTINPYGRSEATFRLQPAGQCEAQIKSCKFNALVERSGAIGRQPLRSVGRICRWPAVARMALRRPATVAPRAAGAYSKP